MDRKIDKAFAESIEVKPSGQKRFEGVRNFFDKTSRLLETVKNVHMGKIKEILVTSSVFSFSLLVSSVPLMAGVYPFGIALICAMNRFGTATAALVGALFGLFFMEESLLLYGAAVLSVYFVRLALGTFGLVKTYHIPVYKGFSGSVRDSPLDEGTYFALAKGTGIKRAARNAFSTAGSVKMLCALGGALTVGLGMILIEGNLWYDVFASVFTGAILKGYDAKKAAGIAADFVVDCLEETVKHPNHSYGPVFEPVLKKLTDI